jgi:hypothetical protein
MVITPYIFALYIIYAKWDFKMSKKEKNDQLLVKINRETKKKFIELCGKDDTTASREVRKFIERYIEGFIDD